jgi:acyl carrier protein phosphodiesterase
LNYLAHAFLSKNNDELMIGNLIADFIKGKNKYNYNDDIQNGILFHKAIDHYTDNHLLIEKSVAVFKVEFKLVGAPIFNDILFDHFLANDSLHFTDESLTIFTKKIYQKLDSSPQLLNSKMASFFNYMIESNLLYSYKTLDGISNSIKGICSRYPKLGNPNLAMECIEKNYLEFNNYYNNFLPDLIHFSNIKIKESQNKLAL